MNPPTLIHRLRGSSGAVSSIAFSPDSASALTGNKRGSLALWNVPEGKIKSHSMAQRGEVQSVAISPNGLFALSAGFDIETKDSSVRLWDLTSCKEIGRFGDDLRITNAVLFTPDGKHAITGSISDSVADSDEEERSGCLRVWDLKTLKEIKRIGTHPAGISCLCLFPSGDRILVGTTRFFYSYSEVIRIYDINSGVELPLIKTDCGPTRVAVSADGSFAVSAGRGTVLWSLEDGREVRRFKTPQFVYDMALSPDNRLLFTANGYQEDHGSPREDCTVRIYDVQTGDEVAVLSKHEGIVTAVAVSPNGEYLLSGDDSGEIILWRL